MEEGRVIRGGRRGRTPARHVDAVPHGGGVSGVNRGGEGNGINGRVSEIECRLKSDEGQVVVPDVVPVVIGVNLPRRGGVHVRTRGDIQVIATSENSKE